LKFFFVKRCIFKDTKFFKKIKQSIKTQISVVAHNNFIAFSKFFLKNGKLIKTRLLLSFVLLNFNHFIYNNFNYIAENSPQIKWVISDIFEKRLNFLYIFDLVINLIKPPFVIKSVAIPKKLKKKTKKKYLIKIVYKNENKRLKSAYKQLYYYSNKFTDSSVNVRLYKAFMFSFLD
jgi:hypothetical protein